MGIRNQGRLGKFLALIILTSPWQVGSVMAAEDVSNLDCAAVLESYAANPKAVPKGVADACQQAINIAPGAGSPAQAQAAAPAIADPCSGAGAQNSVQCWGPWLAPLQPAAGPTPAAVDTTPFDEPRPELLALNVEPPPFDPPVTPCDPGLPCGFATVVTGAQNVAPAEQTIFARFDLAQDGSEFVVDPANGDPDLVSATGMVASFSARPDQYENMRAAGAEGDLRSRLVARVLRQGQDIQLSGDVWAHADLASGNVNSGFYAWGIAATQADIDALTNAGGTLNFSGPMSVDNATMANIALNYGSASWTGNWTNPAYTFSAGGNVAGANFLSDASQFSSNVQDGFVQGALVGPASSRGVAHIIEVTLDGHGLVRDVGMLAETLVP